MVKVKLKKIEDHSYEILIQQGISLNIPKLLKKAKYANKYAIITDSKVAKLYGQKLKIALKKEDIDAEIFYFEEGEKSKHLTTVEKLAEAMIAKGFDRKDAIIALGGGVPGDIAGLLASIYMRGIPFIQIPTTLLAMVDSSVGGKTGADLKAGKNLIGTFNQPRAVFIDTDYLKSLAQKQIRSGLAEIIKYGVIRDQKLFEYIENNLEKIINLDPKALNKIIKRSVEIKAEIVEKDEKEAGERMLLNYGHSYGHALEKISNYSLLHGYAISIGMVIINRMAVEKGLLTPEASDRIRNLLKRAELPTTTMKKPTLKDLSSDKKKQGNHIKLIMPTKIGAAIIQEEKCQ